MGNCHTNPTDGAETQLGHQPITGSKNDIKC